MKFKHLFVFVIFAYLLFGIFSSQSAQARAGVGEYFVATCGESISFPTAGSVAPASVTNGWYANIEGWNLSPLNNGNFTQIASGTSCQRYKDRLTGQGNTDQMRTGMYIRSPEAPSCVSQVAGYPAGWYVCTVNPNDAYAGASSRGDQGALFYNPGGPSTGRYIGTFWPHWGARVSPSSTSGSRDWQLGGISYSDAVNTPAQIANGEISNVLWRNSDSGESETVDSTPGWNGSCWNRSGLTNTSYSTADSCRFKTSGVKKFYKEMWNQADPLRAAIGQPDGARVTQLSLKLLCNPQGSRPYCNTSQVSPARGSEVAVRENIYGARIKLEDEVYPSLYGRSGGWSQPNTTIRGVQGLNGIGASDASNGVMRVGAYVTTAPDQDVRSSLSTESTSSCQFGDNEGKTVAEGLNISSVTVPCPTSAAAGNGSAVWDSNQVSNGWHNVIRYAIDPAGNRSVDDYKVFVDNQPPTVIGGSSCGAGKPEFPLGSTIKDKEDGKEVRSDDPSTVNATSNGSNVWRKGKLMIEACVGDAESGVASARMYYSVNGLGANQANCDPTSTAQNQRGETTLRCTIETKDFKEGDRLTFRSEVTDYGGNVSNRSEESDVRIVDNTAPDVYDITFSKGGKDIELSNGKKWTNKTSLLAEWKVSPKNGAPIRNVDFEYIPGPGCPTLNVNNNGQKTFTPLEMQDDAHRRSVELYNRDVDCGEQGQHMLRVWATDKLYNISKDDRDGGREARAYEVVRAVGGNNSAVNKPNWAKALDDANNTSDANQSTPYYFDNIAPAKPSNERANPSGVTSINNWSVFWTNQRIRDFSKEAVYDAHHVILHGVSDNEFVTRAGGEFKAGTTSPGGGIFDQESNAQRCLSSGGKCKEDQITIPADKLSSTNSTYIYEIWQEDAAGNQSRENSAKINLYYENAGSGCVVN